MRHVKSFHSSQPRHGGNVTLYDVAREAGVSPMTVSRVINGRGDVSEATRNRVKGILTTLNYQVNVAARAARLGTLRIGLVCTHPSAAFLNAHLLGALEQCGQYGIQPVIERAANLRHQSGLVERLIAQNVSGLVLLPPYCDSPAILEKLVKKDLPAVAVATAHPVPGMSAVRIDDYAAASATVNYLLASGHADIGFIKGPEKHSPCAARHQAFLDTMASAGIAIPAERIIQGQLTFRSGLAAARKLLAQPGRPTAIFASNDDMAAGAISAAHRLHLRIPGDIAICGFDNTEIALNVWPELTTIQQPISRMAKIAIDLLVDQIEAWRSGKCWQPQHKILDYTFIKRDST